MQNQIAIVIADDHGVLRESLTALLQSQPDFNVVGSAANGEEALQLVQEHRPHVLVLDLFMPHGDGFEVLRTLDRAGDRVASVVLTGSENQSDYVQVVTTRGTRPRPEGRQSRRSCSARFVPWPRASWRSPMKLRAAC